MNGHYAHKYVISYVDRNRGSRSKSKIKIFLELEHTDKILRENSVMEQLQYLLYNVFGQFYDQFVCSLSLSS